MRGKVEGVRKNSSHEMIAIDRCRRASGYDKHGTGNNKQPQSPGHQHIHLPFELACLRRNFTPLHLVSNTKERKERGGRVYHDYSESDHHHRLLGDRKSLRSYLS